MESMKVAGHAYNYLKNASGRQETELYVPPPLPLTTHLSCSLSGAASDQIKRTKAQAIL